MMSLSSLDRQLAWLNTGGSPVTTVSLLGGEYTLHPYAKEIMQRTYNAGFNIHIVTNGRFQELLEDDEVIDMLRDASRDNLVAVSLDSIMPELNDKYRGVGATHLAVTAIAALKELSIPFRINATPTQNVLDHFGLFALYDFAEEQGAKEVLVHFPSTVGRGTRWKLRDPSYRGGHSREVPIGVFPQLSGANASWGGMRVDTYFRMKDRLKAGEWRDDFNIVIEDGIGDTSECEMLERKSSLQFAPQISFSDSDIPVVACGLNMARARTYSAYILRDGLLKEREGPSELTDARRIWDERSRDERRCPMNPELPCKCIYASFDYSEGRPGMTRDYSRLPGI
jgi:MoaA/NifB/PqqE/SkfB family radical SAM enzyme